MNYKMIIQYEGTRYKGWQRLSNTDMTIQGKIETVLSILFGKPIEIIGSSRTDAGVHAYHQIANFREESEITPAEVKAYLNQYLPEDIGIVSCEAVEEAYHSRFHSKSKTYEYRIWIADYPAVFERKYVDSMTEGELDLDAMIAAGKLLEGTHDFKGFCTDKTKKSTERTIESIQFFESEEELKIMFKGDGFLYNMVRIMVGTLIEVGQGRRTVDSIERIFASKDRSIAGFTACAEGLSLYKID